MSLSQWPHGAYRAAAVRKIKEEKTLERFALPDPRFLPLGRHDPRETAACLWWSGAGIRVKIDCTCMEAEITSTASGHAAWAGVLVDGAPVARFPLLKGTHRYPILLGMEKGFSHEVSIIRDTQASYDEEGPIVLHAVYTDGEPELPRERPLLIEFLGDSLTVGEGCLGPESAMEWRQAWISHMPAFPSLTAEALNAEKRVIALGGWGAARSWDNQADSHIGRIYDRLCAVIPGGDVPVDFEERPADAVVINLGTNDSTALQSMEASEQPLARAELKHRAVELMEAARAHNPKAFILWAYGLCGRQVEDILRSAVEDRRAAGDERVDYLSLSPAITNGSRMHPSREAHRTAAKEISARLRKALSLSE